jgi:hypothetical protein
MAILNPFVAEAGALLVEGDGEPWRLPEDAAASLRELLLESPTDVMREAVKDLLLFGTWLHEDAQSPTAALQIFAILELCLPRLADTADVSGFAPGRADAAQVVGGTPTTFSAPVPPSARTSPLEAFMNSRRKKKRS